ncbi:putative protein related to plant photosystem II stability/assembly factor [Marinibacterium anthonyi]|nr:putative protein related to plant photosystem II stability/assembly factor [Marinibacterium anthonyi]
MADVVTVLVGTTKGVFLIDGDADRTGWSLRGPFCDLWPINHVVGDPETGRIWAGGGGDWNGAGVWRSTDDGQSWTLAKLADGQQDDWARNDPDVARMFAMTPGDPAPHTGEIVNIWSLGYAHGTIYAGAKPATLFASRDGGTGWSRVDGLTNDPSRESWEPGGAGLTLHTIVAHPREAGKLWVGISAAGVFATEDGGATWDRRNRRDNSCGHLHLDHPAAGSDTEVGMCVHNMVRASGEDGDLLYQQNHHGVLRSADGGRSWVDVTKGLPSTFGFPICVHPQDPATAWTIPLNGDSIGRFPPEASAAVWRTRDGGETWEAMRDGLPGANCFFTVLRQAMATDRHDTAGVYFGTNSGSVFASNDEGDSWTEIARHLPTVLSIETMQRPG